MSIFSYDKINFEIVSNFTNKINLSNVIVCEGARVMDNEQLKLQLKNFQQGDMNAFKEIYEELKVPVYTIIYRILYDHMMAEDVMQEVFLRLYKKLPTLQMKNPRAFIFQMARNLAIDYKRQIKESNPLTNEITVNKNSIDFVISTKLDVELAIKKLTLIEREIITLRLNNGLKFREISKVVNKPIGTVLWKYQQSIKKLRILLSGGGD